MSRASGEYSWMTLGLPWIKRGVARVLDRGEPVIEMIIRLCGWSAIIFVVAIFLFVFKEGAGALTEINLKEFLTSPNWRPTSERTSWWAGSTTLRRTSASSLPWSGRT